MTDPQFYLNGQFVSGPPGVPAGDAGFVVGATITDLVRTFGGRLFRLEDHLARFRESCRLCRVPLAATDEELRAAAGRLVGRPTHDLALVLLATPGPLGHYAGSAENGPPTLMMHTFPLPFAR